MYGMDEISELSITSLIWKPTECQNFSALSGVMASRSQFERKVKYSGNWFELLRMVCF